MKKLSALILVALAISCNSLRAQCTINTGNTTAGITPANGQDTLTQAAIYQQTLQVYIPATYLGVPIDSVHLSVSGEPDGLTVVYVPASGNGETIAGGANGVICFAGLTFDTVGVYPLVFTGTVYTGGNTVALASLPANFSYTFYVKAPATQGFACDTVMNLSPGYDDTVIIPLTAPEEGFLSGNGAISYNNTYYPFIAVAEKLVGGVGDSVTGALVQFGHVSINPADSLKPIGIYVYDDNGPLATGALTGGPGAALDSAFITLKTIAADVQNHAFSTVAFGGRAQLTTPHFFIVVKLPQTTGDTLAVFTNTASTTNGAGYLLVTVWYPYSLAAGLNGDSLGNFIGATLCGSQPLAPNAGFDVVPAHICLGTAARFNNVTLGDPTGYSWNFGDGSAQSSLMNPEHTYADTGTYLVTLTASNAGGAVTNGAYLKVLPNPAATNFVKDASSPAATDGAIGVHVTAGAPPFTYVWNLSLLDTDSLSGLAPAIYIVNISDSNTCTAADTIQVGVLSGIASLYNYPPFNIYPNPANNVLYLQSGSAISSIELINALGQSILSRQVNSNACRLQTDGLAPGNYILLAHTLQGTVSRPLIIMH